MARVAGGREGSLRLGGQYEVLSGKTNLKALIAAPVYLPWPSVH